MCKVKTSGGLVWHGDPKEVAYAALPPESLDRLEYRTISPLQCQHCAAFLRGKKAEKRAADAPLPALLSPAARGASSAVPSRDAQSGAAGRGDEAGAAATPHAPQQPTPPSLPPGVLLRSGAQSPLQHPGRARVAHACRYRGATEASVWAVCALLWRRVGH